LRPYFGSGTLKATFDHGQIDSFKVGKSRNHKASF
jgi:hypothetical protein